ncbi:hypothetical protein SprV_1002831500 [Sparganum proliferum]
MASQLLMASTRLPTTVNSATIYRRPYHRLTGRPGPLSRGHPTNPYNHQALGGSERANSEIRRISFTSELSSVNLKGLDDVMQELRDANANVTVAVRAAARDRRYQGFASSSSASQSPPSRNTLPTTLWTPMKRES